MSAASAVDGHSDRRERGVGDQLGWKEGWTKWVNCFTHFDGRPPPPALGFRWSPEPDYPPPT